MKSLDDIDRSRDHFELFDLPRAFDIDLDALRKTVNALSRLTHPDLAGSDPEQQARAIELSAKVNEAYRTLADDEARANYLLELLGGPSKEQDKSLPGEFLMEMMSVREELADAQMAEDPQSLARFESEAKARRRQHLATVADLFRDVAAATGDTRAALLSEIRLQLNCLRYVERMLEQIHPGGQTLL